MASRPCHLRDRFLRRDPHRQLLRPHQVGAHARLHLARRPHGRLSEYRIFDVFQIKVVWFRLMGSSERRRALQRI